MPEINTISLSCPILYLLVGPFYSELCILIVTCSSKILCQVECSLVVLCYSTIAPV